MFDELMHVVCQLCRSYNYFKAIRQMSLHVSGPIYSRVTSQENNDLGLIVSLVSYSKDDVQQ